VFKPTSATQNIFVNLFAGNDNSTPALSARYGTGAGFSSTTGLFVSPCIESFDIAAPGAGLSAILGGKPK